jgi:hypothetical protein
LDVILSQLSEITNVRNAILHHGAASVGDGKWVVSNALLAHTKDRIKTTNISVPILNAMSTDLTVIAMLLLAIGYLPKFPDFTKASSQAMRSLWQYKPEKPQPTKPKGGLGRRFGLGRK